jgi:hypothetical protein
VEQRVGSVLARLGIVALVLIAACSASATGEITLDFEDVAPGEIPDGYGGLQWSTSFHVYDKTGLDPGWTGYQNGVVSGNRAAYNWYALDAQASDGLFTFHGAYLTAAWLEGLEVQVLGYDTSVSTRIPRYEEIVSVSQTEATWFDFDFVGIDSLWIRTPEGIQDPPPGTTNLNVIVDDLTIEFIPEPSTSALFALGLFALALRRRRCSVPSRCVA